MSGFVEDVVDGCWQVVVTDFFNSTRKKQSRLAVQMKLTSVVARVKFHFVD